MVEETNNGILTNLENKTNSEINLSYDPRDFDSNIATLKALTAKSLDDVSDSGEEFNLATRMLLEDYDGDDLKKLLQPLFDKYPELCFLFFSLRSSRDECIGVRIARGDGIDVFNKRNNDVWLKRQRRFVTFNFFRTGEYNFDNLEYVKKVVKDWQKIQKDKRGQTIGFFKAESESSPSDVNGKTEEQKELFYVAGPLYRGKNGESKSTVTDDNDPKNGNEKDDCFTSFKSIVKWNPEEAQGPARDVTIDDVQILMDERVVPFSDEVLSQCGFRDKNRRPCVRDYVLPFFFNDRNGANQYYGRVRFGLSVDAKLQEILQRFYKLASALFEIELYLGTAVSAKLYKRHYVESRQVRRNFLNAILSRDPERFDSEKVRETYGRYIHSVFNNDPRMLKYKGNLCLLQTTIPRAQMPDRLRDLEYDRLPFDSEFVDNEGETFGNIRALRNFTNREKIRIGKNIDKLLPYALGANREFQMGLLQWASPLGSYQQAQISNSRKFFLKKLNLAMLPEGSEKLSAISAQIRDNFGKLSLKSPELSVCVIPRPRSDWEVNNEEKSAYYFWASGSELFSADNSQINVKKESRSYENNFQFPQDPGFDTSLVVLYDQEKPFDLGLWSVFWAMKNIGFKDMYGRTGDVLVGMPFTFEDDDLSGEPLCYRFFAVLSHSDEAIDAGGRLHYYDDLYDVFYELVDELRLVKKGSFVAEQRGREKARRQGEPIAVARRVSNELFKRYAGCGYSELRDQRVRLSLAVRKVFEFLDDKKITSSNIDDRAKACETALKNTINRSAITIDYIGGLVAREIAPSDPESANETRPDLRAERFQTLFERTVADCAKADNFSPAECMCNRVVYSIRENDVRKIQGKDVKEDANRAKFWAVLFVCLKVAILKLARERNLRDPDAETSERYKRMQRKMNEELRRKLKTMAPEDVLTEADVDIEEIYKALFPFPSKTLCLPWDSQDKYRQSCESAFKVNRIFDSIEEFKEKSSRKKKGADKADNKIKISDVRNGNLKFLKKITNGEEILRSFLKEAADDILDNYMKEIQARVW